MLTSLVVHPAQMPKQGGAVSVGNMLPVLGVHSARLAATGWGPQTHGLEAVSYTHLTLPTILLV